MLVPELTKPLTSNDYFDKFVLFPLKRYIKKRPLIRDLLIRALFSIKGKSRGIKVQFSLEHVSFIKGNKIIRINKKHILYGLEIINSFEYFYSAIEAIPYFGFNLIDYSSPRYHDVIGYDKHPIYFPAFAEPLITTKQYLEFSRLAPDSIVIDLGSYSGLTSIIFKDIVGATGTVIAVEADKNNLIAMTKNFLNYKKVTNNKIEILYGAVWIHNKGLNFSSEGNMGSSASDIVGNARGKIITVPSYTLMDIAKKYNLNRVDFIKCDVEGAETVLFEDATFFERYKPRIVIEAHIIDNKETTNKFIEDLKKYGYICQRITQIGVTLPLVICTPPEEIN